MKNHFVLLALFSGMAMCTAQSDVVVLNDSETYKNLKGILASMAKSATPADLSLSEIAQVNALMEESIRNYNRALKEGTKRKQSKMYRIMALKKYKLQMVPYINEKGEKEI
ncbi:MAG: hypothetical protein AAF969_16130 [Bacteroidota bacterium]